jgi:hypothetical protein
MYLLMVIIAAVLFLGAALLLAHLVHRGTISAHAAAVVAHMIDARMPDLLAAAGRTATPLDDLVLAYLVEPVLTRLEALDVPVTPALRAMVRTYAHGMVPPSAYVARPAVVPEGSAVSDNHGAPLRQALGREAGLAQVWPPQSEPVPLRPNKS